MKLFRNYTMTWWQVGLLKTYVMVVGLLFGSYFASHVMAFTVPLLIIFAVLAVYFIHQMFTGGLSTQELEKNCPGIWVDFLYVDMVRKTSNQVKDTSRITSVVLNSR